MIVIRNDRLFGELRKSPTWGTLFSGRKYPELKDDRIPTLAGGLDRIEVKRRGVYFYDRGCNGVDRSFVVRPELHRTMRRN